jgi:hypothetical protein
LWAAYLVDLVPRTKRVRRETLFATLDNSKAVLFTRQEIKIAFAAAEAAVTIYNCFEFREIDLVSKGAAVAAASICAPDRRVLSFSHGEGN